MEERSFDEYKEPVDQHLMDFIPNIDNKSISLYESMKYSLTAGGKRLRPVLLLAACEFAGGNIKEAIPLRLRHRIYPYLFSHSRRSACYGQRRSQKRSAYQSKKFTEML